MAHIASAERAPQGSAAIGYWLSTKVIGQPLALHGEVATRLNHAINKGDFDPQFLVGGLGASKFIGTIDNRSRYRVTEDGVALVAIQGTLIDRGAFLGDMWGMLTTYEGLAEQFRRLAKDDDIKSVILDIDSPGGMVAGLFDLMGELEALKSKKKVVAVAANMAASAAYAIGCAAHKLYVSEMGLAGSIGTIKIHQSYAEMMANAGVETTIIHAGRNKANGNPYQALSDLARCEMTAEVDQANDKFVAHVAKHRPLDEAAVRALEARCYFGAEAVKAKLADGVMSVELALESIRTSSKSARGSTSKSNGGRMSHDSNASAAQADTFATALAAAINAIAKPAEASAAAAVAPVAPAAPAPAPVAAAAPAAAAPAAAPAAPAAAPASADAARERIAAILDCDAGKERPSLARHIALKTDLDLDQAVAMLGASPVEAAAAPAARTAGDALAARMADPNNSAGVKPDAATSAGRGSFADFAAKAPARNK